MESFFLSTGTWFAALAIPSVFFLAAATAPLASNRFRRVQAATTVVLVGWLGLVALATLGGIASPTAPALRALGLPVRVDAATLILLGLITGMAFVLTRFSVAYLRGDPRQNHYFRWLMATLGSVALLIVSEHLLLLAASWIATSLSLHQLLTFYPDRPKALIAAHKKFIVSRVADVLLLFAFGLIGTAAHSFELHAIHRWAEEAGALPLSVQIACVLLVVSASLKCAQLPFHGWLIQVMEAPTPVSALLHAGVVNLGGVMLIRLAPIMVMAEAAQILLVVIGAGTAVVAALVMTTRVSIKVSLAWSTFAQMGFMLLQWWSRRLSPGPPPPGRALALQGARLPH